MLNRFAPPIARQKCPGSRLGMVFGMRLDAIVCAAWIIAAAACGFAATAAAQDAAGAAIDSTVPPVNADEAANPPPETPLTPDEAAELGNALTFDSATLTEAKPAKPLRLPGLADTGKFDVSGKPDGSSTMTFNRPLAGEWDAKVGADLNLAPAPGDTHQPDRPLPVIGGKRDFESAWASVALPNLAMVDARLDPGNDQSKVGTTFKHSIPVGGSFSVTLQDSYSVTQSIGAPAAAPSAVPLMAAPSGGPAATPQFWGNEKAVKFDVLSRGTTFGAGVTSASNDPITHNTFSADQKLYGPLHVTTAVTDFGQPTASKSINAALKLNW